MSRAGKIRWQDRHAAMGAMKPVAATPAIGPIIHGQKTVSSPGTPERLREGTQPLESGVTVKALTDNAGIIYVGSDAVDSSNGFTLNADEQIFIEVEDTKHVWLDISQQGDGVSYIGT